MATFNIHMPVVMPINLFADNASSTSLIRIFLTVSADLSTLLFTAILSRADFAPTSPCLAPISINVLPNYSKPLPSSTVNGLMSVEQNATAAFKTLF